MNSRPHTILVTGGTGFVGSHVVEELLSEGHAVRCHIRKGRSSLSWLEGLPVEVVDADVRSPREMEAALNGIDTIIHVAGLTKARTLDDYRAVNVEMTRHLIASAVQQDVKRFVFVGSLTAVGPSTDGIALDESAACVPITFYGQSKLEAENVCRTYADRIDLTILRPPAVYGPRDSDILEMFRWVAHGIRPILGSSSKTLSLIHVKDLARMIVAAAIHAGPSGRTYFVSDPDPYGFDDLIRTIAAVSGRRTFPLFIPGPMLYIMASITETIASMRGRQAVLTTEKARDILQPTWVCSSRAFENDVGLRSKIPVEQGLRETYDWYREKGWLP